jgi:hypothetical protein
MFLHWYLTCSQQAARKSSRKATPGAKRPAAGVSGPSWTLAQAPLDLPADGRSESAAGLVSQPEIMIKPGPVAEALEDGTPPQTSGSHNNESDLTLPDSKVTLEGQSPPASILKRSPQALPNGRAPSYPLKQTPFQPSGSLPTTSDMYATQDDNSGSDGDYHACMGCGNCPVGLHVFFCGGLTSRLYKGLRRFLLLRIQAGSS